MQRGLAWIAGMQSEDGGWGAFDADNTSTWLYKLPFCDFGAVIDPPSEDVSAHALEALAQEPAYENVVRRGLHYLARQPASRRLLVGAVGREPPLRHGGGAAGARGVRRRHGHPAFERAAAWLDSVQQPDGGFGEDIRSYHEPAWRGRGVATASQTAWALVAYVAAGKATGLPPEGRRTISVRHSSTTATGRSGTTRAQVPHRFHDPLPPLPAPLPAAGARPFQAGCP